MEELLVHGIGLVGGALADTKQQYSPIQSTVESEKCTVHIVQYTVQIALCTVHSATVHSEVQPWWSAECDGLLKDGDTPALSPTPTGHSHGYKRSAWS